MSLRRAIGEPGDERGFLLAFLAAALLVVTPLWVVRYPPMADLPQHAVQIQLWRDFDELDPAIRSALELRPLTPYLGCYLLGRLLFLVFSPLVAMKVMVSLAFIALPASAVALLRVFDRSRWWALVAFPAAYSVSAAWGLLNFLLAMPLAVVLVGLSVADARETQPRRRVTQLGLALLLLVTHGMVCALALTIAGCVALTASRTIPDLLRRAAPLIPAGLAGIAWFSLTASREHQIAGTTEWDLTPKRLLGLPFAFLTHDYGPVVVVVSLFLTLLVVTSIRRTAEGRRDQLRRLVPVSVALAAYLLAPSSVFLAAFLNRRFAPLVLVFALPLVGAGNPRRWQRFAFLGCLAIASLDLTTSALRFDAEASGLDAVMLSMQPEKRVLGLVFDPATPGLETASLLVQQVAWVQIEKGGWVDFNFAYFYVQLVHLREPAKHAYTYVLQWKPELFDPRRWGDYDYFVVHRVAPDPGPALFRDAPFPWRLRDHAGNWWLYERLDREPASPAPAAPTG